MSQSQSKNPYDRYFAARPKSEIGNSLANRLEEECKNEERAALAEVYATAYGHYYGFDLGRGPTFGITRGGDQGELAEIRINKARAVAKSFLSLVIGPKVNWRPQAASNAADAKAATTLALGLLEWYWKKGGMERVYARMAEMAIAWGESFVAPLWDPTLGPIIGLEPDPLQPGRQRPKRGGDIRLHNFLPWDVVRDGGARSYEATQWKFLRLWANKWDLIGLHPKDILGEPTKENILSASKDDQMRLASPMASEQSDLVPVWHFFHDPSPSLPMGREVVLVSGRCVLVDRMLSYGTQDERSTPLVRFALDEMFGTPFGYSSWWDTLAIQELMDGLETAIASNQLALATQSIGVQKGTTTSTESGTGLKIWEIPVGGMAPTAVQLTKSPPEVFNHLDKKTNDQQQLMNLNDTYRGQPDTAQMNAQAFTVLATQAIQQNGPAQRAALDAVAQIGTKTLQTVAERVTDDRKVRITGKQQKYLYTSVGYKGSSLKCIDEVFVDIGNPIEQTAAGRFTLAQMFQSAKQANGENVSVEQLQQVVDVGRMEPVTQSGRDEMALIDSENDRLSSGEKVQAHALDNHLLHGRENPAPIRNPEGRANKQVNDNTMEHIHEHYVLHYGLPPPKDPVTGAPLKLSAYETAMQDPQYFARIRLLMGQPPPVDVAPAPGMPGAPGSEAAPPEEGAQSVMGQPGPPDMPTPAPSAEPPGPVPPIVQPNGSLPLQ